MKDQELRARSRAEEPPQVGIGEVEANQRVDVLQSRPGEGAARLEEVEQAELPAPTALLTMMVQRTICASRWAVPVARLRFSNARLSNLASRFAKYRLIARMTSAGSKCSPRATSISRT